MLFLKPLIVPSHILLFVYLFVMKFDILQMHIFNYKETRKLVFPPRLNMYIHLVVHIYSQLTNKYIHVDSLE